MKNPRKLCTITGRKGDFWTANFEPGLPYDKQTKGVPHTKLRLWFATVQRHDGQGNTYLMMDTGEGQKHSNYIVAMVPVYGNAQTERVLINALTKLGYSVATSQDELARKAGAKLTKAELAALLRQHRRGESEE